MHEDTKEVVEGPTPFITAPEMSIASVSERIMAVNDELTLDDDDDELESEADPAALRVTSMRLLAAVRRLG